MFMPLTDLFFVVPATEVDFLEGAKLLSNVLKTLAFVVLLDKADGEMSRCTPDFVGR